jgi:hypothetical protein
MLKLTFYPIEAIKEKPQMEETPDITDELSAWLVDELHDVALGDKRLERRLLTTGAQLAARPSGSINQACAAWADTKAAYRLFANAKTTAEKIRAPHYRRTRERARGHQRLFALQDTTYLNYTHHPATKGLGHRAAEALGPGHAHRAAHERAGSSARIDQPGDLGASA